MAYKVEIEFNKEEKTIAKKVRGLRIDRIYFYCPAHLYGLPFGVPGNVLVKYAKKVAKKYIGERANNAECILRLY